MNRNIYIILSFLAANLIWAFAFDTGLLHALELSAFQAAAIGLTAMFYEKELKYVRENRS